VRGQTIGKRAMGLWVRAASGGRASLNSISARTVLRLIDVLPFFYLLGTLVALLSGSRRRRVGDWAGATVVVRDEGVAHEQPRRASWRVAGYPALWLFGVLFAIFALGLGKTAGEREAIAQYPSCLAAGISTVEGREGTCARGGGQFGPITLYTVVDYRHALRMPEYEAHVLSSTIAPTRVPNWSENPGLYPDGHGQLVSFHVTITNTGSEPLAFGSGPAQETTPSYERHPIVELALPSAPGSAGDVAYPPILNGRSSPAPSIFQPSLIPPGGRSVGWVTFVAPAWALSVLRARPADVNFLRADGTSGYVGQIRLWK
jgi:RDD family